MDSIIVLLLTSSVLAGIVGAFLNGFWNRRAAKKAPKTQMRAEAYRDFVVHMVSVSFSASPSVAVSDSSAGVDLDEIIARLLLFGEGNVVDSVSTFLGRYGAINSERATMDFTKVVCEMRKSLMTGHKEIVSQSIRNLLSTMQLKHGKP